MATYARKLKDSSGNVIAPATRATCVYMSDNTTLEDFVNNLDLKVTGIYPVGSIYQSTDAASPASLFGGEWESIQGRFLLGTSSSYEVSSTGGEETHKLTIDEMPSHNHKFSGVVTYGPNNEVTQNSATHASPLNLTTYTTGGDQPHNNMPPYYAVNIWRRVA